MKTYLIGLLTCCSVWVSANPAPDDIVKRANDAEKASYWSAQLTVKHVSSSGNAMVRTGKVAMMLNAQSDPMRLFSFSAPADIAGTMLLNHEKAGGEDNVWLYLPALSKTRRIASGNKKNSFIGTQFTFADLATPKISQYNHKLLREDKMEGEAFYVIESVAKSPQVISELGYAKVQSWINKSNYCTHQIDYYDPQGVLVKSQKPSKFVKLEERSGAFWVATVRLMKNNINNELTEISLADLRNEPLSESMFSPSRLER